VEWQSAVAPFRALIDPAWLCAALALIVARCGATRDEPLQAPQL